MSRPQGGGSSELPACAYHCSRAQDTLYKHVSAREWLRWVDTMGDEHLIEQDAVVAEPGGRAREVKLVTPGERLAPRLAYALAVLVKTLVPVLKREDVVRPQVLDVK